MVCIKTHVFVITAVVWLVECKTSNGYNDNLNVETDNVFNTYDLTSKQIEGNNSESGTYVYYIPTKSDIYTKKYFFICKYELKTKKYI